MYFRPFIRAVTPFITHRGPTFDWNLERFSDIWPFRVEEGIAKSKTLTFKIVYVAYILRFCHHDLHTLVQRNFGMQPVKCALAKIDCVIMRIWDVFFTFQNWGRWTQFDLEVFVRFCWFNYQTRYLQRIEVTPTWPPKNALWTTRVSKKLFNKIILSWSLTARPRKWPGPQQGKHRLATIIP